MPAFCLSPLQLLGVTRPLLVIFTIISACTFIERLLLAVVYVISDNQLAPKRSGYMQ